VVAAESQRREVGARLFTWLAFAAVSLPIVAIIAYVVFSALGLL
jgi:hypothetical protein